MDLKYPKLDIECFVSIQNSTCDAKDPQPSAFSKDIKT
jgi:hypothetical protein